MTVKDAVNRINKDRGSHVGISIGQKSQERIECIFTDIFSGVQMTLASSKTLEGAKNKDNPN